MRHQLPISLRGVTALPRNAPRRRLYRPQLWHRYRI